MKILKDYARYKKMREISDNYIIIFTVTRDMRAMNNTYVIKRNVEDILKN